MVKADPSKWTAHNGRAEFSDSIIHFVNTSDRTALLWLNNIDFKNGVIELDCKGNDVRGKSFLGLALHGTDTINYDAIYFRPFNFRDPERKNHSVQYIDKPDNDWDLLREKHTGKYEKEINPPPDPNDWFHAKILIKYPIIRVYINGSKNPCLEVTQISRRKSGKLALWIDSDDGWFKNIQLTGLLP